MMTVITKDEAYYLACDYRRFHEDLPSFRGPAQRERIIDCGLMASGRRFIAVYTGKRLMIRCGCRWFTVPQARKHWRGKRDRAITRAALDYAVAVAKARHWKVGER